MLGDSKFAHRTHTDCHWKVGRDEFSLKQDEKACERFNNLISSHKLPTVNVTSNELDIFVFLHSFWKSSMLKLYFNFGRRVRNINPHWQTHELPSKFFFQTAHIRSHTLWLIFFLRNFHFRLQKKQSFTAFLCFSCAVVFDLLTFYEHLDAFFDDASAAEFFMNF